jgi:citrate lyase subunit beta/citryl-CoA lyase
MLSKAAGLAADEVILDLEDSVAAGAKGSDVREAIAAALRAGLRATTRAVRVNAVDTPHCHRDIVAVVEGAGAFLDAVVLPKVEDPGHVTFADHLLRALERELGLPPGGIGLEAQIETARGLSAVDAIAAHHDRHAGSGLSGGRLAPRPLAHPRGGPRERAPGGRWPLRGDRRPGRSRRVGRALRGPRL